jgi:CheY-like chemotaxis protein
MRASGSSAGFLLAVSRGHAVLATLGWMPTRCLIVDDNEAFLAAARVLLERQGLTVAIASTGAEALRQARSLRPDVALVDISLGEESGLDVARRLAEDGLDDGPAVVLISTRTEDEVADLIAGCPVAGFLPKSELSASAIRRIRDGRSH